MHGAVSEQTVGVVLETVNTMQADSKDVARMEKKKNHLFGINRGQQQMARRI